MLKNILKIRHYIRDKLFKKVQDLHQLLGFV